MNFKHLPSPSGLMVKRLSLSKRLINTFKLEKLVLRIPNDPEEISLRPPKPNVPDSTLTSSEISLITESPFVKNLIPIENSPDNPAIPEKVSAVAQYIPMKNGLLTYHRPKTVPTPFQVYTKPGALETPGHVSLSEFPRLSVTKILTKSWCELRDFFEIYSMTPRDETDAMIRGRQDHLALELETHPEIDMSSVTEHIPQVEPTAVDVYAQTVVDTILRLVTLLQHGRAREIYVHGFIDEFGVIDERKGVNEETMIVTGVIDHLVLLSNDRSRPLEKRFSQFNDLKDIVDNAADIISEFPDSYRLLVSDVKTRSRATIPHQKSVLDAAKHQVMIYRNFLEVLGSDVGFDWLKEYCSRKKLDIDQPLTPEIVLGMIYIHDIFYKDFERIRDGEINGLGDVSYDLTYLGSQITETEMLEKVSPFLKPWKQAPTTRYFLTRLTEMLHSTSLLLKDDLRVEYMHRGENIQNVNFKYDHDQMSNVTAQGLEFWKGLRDPQAVDGSFSELNSKCKYCDFKDFCLWNKELEQQNYHMGEIAARSTANV